MDLRGYLLKAVTLVITQKKGSGGRCSLLRVQTDTLDIADTPDTPVTADTPATQVIRAILVVACLGIVGQGCQDIPVVDSPGIAVCPGIVAAGYQDTADIQVCQATAASQVTQASADTRDTVGDLAIAGTLDRLGCQDIVVCRDTVVSAVCLVTQASLDTLDIPVTLQTLDTRATLVYPGYLDIVVVVGLDIVDTQVIQGIAVSADTRGLVGTPVLAVTLAAVYRVTQVTQVNQVIAGTQDTVVIREYQVCLDTQAQVCRDTLGIVVAVCRATLDIRDSQVTQDTLG